MNIYHCTYDNKPGGKPCGITPCISAAGPAEAAAAHSPKDTPRRLRRLGPRQQQAG
jgi:hypothetical protein